MNINIRVIYDYNLNKMITQYNQIKSFIPKHEKFVYNNQSNIFPKSKYNIFFDTISENAYNILPTDNTILIVNEEYVNYLIYLRRENYSNKPLLLLDNIVNYYICLTKYSNDVLIKTHKILKKKIIYINGFTNSIKELIPSSNKYILYDIDVYSGQNNYLILEIWIKYFLERSEKLIIKYYFEKDYVVTYFKKLLNLKKIEHKKKYFYKNIILTTDESIYKNDIYAVILNTSYYQLTTKLYEHIFKNHIIITNKNLISDEIIKDKKFLLKEYSEENIVSVLNKLFNNESKYKLNYENIVKKIKNTSRKINKLISLNNDYVHKNNNNLNQDKLCQNTQLSKNTPLSIPEQIFLVNKYHNEVLRECKFNKNNIPTINIQNYYRILKNPSKKTDFGYTTTIFCDNKFLNLILTGGYTLKYITKTKYNIICLVQDKPYYDGDIYFPGLSADEIEDVKKIYDCVIGIDLLKTNIDKIKYLIQYRNIAYYSTKVLCLGLIQYKKLLFFDASTLISSNIDHVLTDNNRSTYYNMYQFVKCKRGLVGNLILITPKQKYFNRAIYLVSNYNTILEKKYNHYTNDEDIIYYSIYPEWNNKMLDDSLFSFNYHRIPNIVTENDKHKKIYEVQFYVQAKPMRYSLKDDHKERFLFNENHSCYYLWDLSSSKLLLQFPELAKYFEYIKTYRYIH